MLAICIDASHRRGFGHLYRALVLRQELASRGVIPVFVVNNDPVALRILEREAVVIELAAFDETGTNWESSVIRRHGITCWLNDRFVTELDHARRVKREGVRLFTMEDRGPGAAAADVHFAPLANAGELVPGTRVERGLEYLVINPEFGRCRRRREAVGSVVVSMGGADTWNLAPAISQMVAGCWPVPITVILGPSSHVTAEQLPGRCTVKHGVPSLVEEFFKHDLAFTAGGMTPFEAAATGLPTVVIAAETHEIENAQRLENIGASRYAGFRHEVAPEIVCRPGAVAEMSAAAIAGVPTDGARRVCDVLLEERCAPR